MNIDCLHEEALSCAKDLKRSESRLIEVLQRVDEHQVWRCKGFGSLHAYVVEALGLSDDQAYHFTRVARKAREVPELKHAIDQGVVKLSQARRILKVLTPETKTEWLEKAATLKQRELEREVARVHPQAAVPERIKPLSGDLSELRCSLPKDVEELLRRAREVESQRSAAAASLADVLRTALNTYLDKHDPVRRAQRNGHKAVSVSRRNLSASVRHQVYLRDKGRCTYPGCGSERWIDIHHVVPRSQGGSNDVGNLTTLCRSHHRSRHGQLGARRIVRRGAPPDRGAVRSDSLDRFV